MIGNGFCDDVNNIGECNWDGGDCCSKPVIKGQCEDCSCKNSDQDFCDSKLLFDGTCHRVNNNPECHYDGFDCCTSPIGKVPDGQCSPLDFGCDISALQNNQCDKFNASCSTDLKACCSDTTGCSFVASTYLFVINSTKHIL